VRQRRSGAILLGTEAERSDEDSFILLYIASTKHFGKMCEVNRLEDVIGIIESH
jgi:hypothetical protein